MIDTIATLGFAGVMVVGLWHLGRSRRSSRQVDLLMETLEDINKVFRRPRAPEH